MGHPRAGEAGQGVVEYILLLATISSIALLVFRALKTYDLAGDLVNPITSNYVFAYQYGNRLTCGPEDVSGASGHICPGGSGAVVHHPRLPDPPPANGTSANGNFRVFINPH